MTDPGPLFGREDEQYRFYHEEGETAADRAVHRASLRSRNPARWVMETLAIGVVWAWEAWREERRKWPS